MADNDPLSFTLEAIRARDCAVWHARGRATVTEAIEAAKDDVPRLLAALGTVLAKHHPEDSEPCCAECGFTWECPTVQDITREMTGEDGSHGEQ